MILKEEVELEVGDMIVFKRERCRWEETGIEKMWEEKIGIGEE